MTYPDRFILDNSDTSSFLNSMGNNEHTIVIRTYTTNAAESDFIGNFTEGGIMSMFFDSKLRAHVDNADSFFVTDSSGNVTLNTEIFVGSRFKNVGGLKQLERQQQLLLEVLVHLFYSHLVLGGGLKV
jgi:hypothetical protein